VDWLLVVDVVRDSAGDFLMSGTRGDDAAEDFLLWKEEWICCCGEVDATRGAIRQNMRVKRGYMKSDFDLMGRELV
jgi:hypothetical protein